jgi:LysM repeat protein
MKRLRLLVPVAVITAVVLLLIAPAGAFAAPNEGAHGGGCVQWHTVRCGQTLSGIARMYGTSVDYLMSINGIHNPNKIYAGTNLCVAAGHPEPQPGPRPGPGPRHCDDGFTYVVKCGDTVGNIAWRFGVNSTYLAQANGLWNPNVIYAGQRLWIPSGCW